MSQQAAIRRRRQFAKGYRHLAKLGRPQYKLFTSLESSQRKLQRLAEKKRAEQERAKKK